MSQPFMTLIQRPGKIFETLGHDEFWVQGDYEDGLTIEEESMLMQQILVEAYFVLPHFWSGEPGRYPILTVARGWTGRCPDEPQYWAPKKRDHVTSGVFLHITYEPSTKTFYVGMNVGTKGVEIQSVQLGEGIAYTGRVLKLLVMISRNGMFPSIEGLASSGEDLFGDLELANMSRIQPWGRPVKGQWWIMSGAEGWTDDGETSFPAGFGVSDLQITLFDDATCTCQSLPYSGALNHLVSDEDPRVLDVLAPLSGEVEALEVEQTVSELLLDLADDLQRMSGNAETWANELLFLAEETGAL